MTKLHSNQPKLRIARAAAAVAILLAGPVHAVTTIWDGGGPLGDSLWNTASNWAGDVVPPAAHDVQFASGFGSGTIIDINGNRTANSLIINTASPFTLVGDRFFLEFLTLTSGNLTRTNTGGPATLIDVSLRLGQNGTWSTSGTVHVTGPIYETTPGRSLTKTGSSLLTLAGGGTYSGGTFVNQGSLQMTSIGAGTGTITVASGAALLLDNAVIANPITLSGVLGNSFSSSNGSTVNGPITLQGNASINANISSGLTVNGAISDGAGASILTKAGTGLLQLNAPTAHTGNTDITQGTLTLGHAEALGTGVTTIRSGAALHLPENMNVNRALELYGASGDVPTLRAGANSTWSGPITAALGSSAQIASDGGLFTISGNISGGTLWKVHEGRLVLSGNNSFARFNVEFGTLSLQSDGAAGRGVACSAADANIEISGSINTPTTSALFLGGSGINGQGVLRVLSGTSTWGGPISLSETATVFVAHGAQLTSSGAISGSGSGLIKTGAGTLVLSGVTAAFQYSGGTTIEAGTVSISSDSNIGPGPINVTGGTLLFNASTTTTRNVTLTGGRLQAAAGAAVTINGSNITGGFLMGPGTFHPQGSVNLSGVTALAGSNLSPTGTTYLNAFINGGNLSSATALTWNGGTNSSSGKITINSGALSTTAFSNDGVITINSGGALLNTGNSLTSGGGSRITINPGGTLNVSDNALDLNGALLVNNGTITGTTNVNFLSLAKGAGLYGAVNVTDGGKFSPGNSPGSVTTDSVTWHAGAGYLFEINDAAGTQGTNWDLWNISGSLNITAGTTANSRFTIFITSLDATNAAGNAANFNNAQSYQWLIASTTTGITGFTVNKFTLDISDFSNPLGGGSFALNQVGNDLFLNFNAPSGPPQWNVDAGGSWSTPGNWLPPTVPNSPAASANFLGQITAPRTVTLDGDKTVGSINFDNANSYTIAPGSGGTLSVVGDVDPNGNNIKVISGNHTISAPLSLPNSTGFLVFPGASLHLSGPISIAAGQSLTGSGVLTISGPQNHGAGASYITEGPGLTTLNSNAGTPATATTAAIANLGFNLGANASAVFGEDQVLRYINLATSDGPEHLNLNSPSAPGAFRSLRVYAADLALAKANLYEYISTANAPGAPDPTLGIYDTGRGLHSNSGIGLALLPDAHGDNHIFIRLTRIGDLNLDGLVTISDFIDLASHFNGAGTWQEGDLNYDGNVTISDFIDLASNFNSSYSGESWPIGAEHQRVLDNFAASVPEPGMAWGALALSSILLRRHRRGC